MARLARIVAPGGPHHVTAAETTGRPLGTGDFVADLERRLGRPIARRAPGRKPASKVEERPALL